jgi:hypothetical protein
MAGSAGSVSLQGASRVGKGASSLSNLAGAFGLSNSTVTSSSSSSASWVFLD